MEDYLNVLPHHVRECLRGYGTGNTDIAKTMIGSLVSLCDKIRHLSTSEFIRPLDWNSMSLPAVHWRTIGIY